MESWKKDLSPKKPKKDQKLAFWSTFFKLELLFSGAPTAAYSCAGLVPGSPQFCLVYIFDVYE